MTQLLDQLDDGFELLSAGDRLAPSRQRSLAATVKWSYQLLTDQEQRVFRMLSVFPAPFSLEAAEAVAVAAAGAGPEAEEALAGYALGVAEDATAGLQTSTGEVAAALWLDAEDATVHQGLALTLGYDQGAGLRLAVALAPWWRLRGRYAAGTAWLRVAVGQAAPGSDLWCAAYLWLGSVAVNTSDCANALGYFTVVRDARLPRIEANTH